MARPKGSAASHSSLWFACLRKVKRRTTQTRVHVSLRTSHRFRSGYAHKAPVSQSIRPPMSLLVFISVSLTPPHPQAHLYRSWETNRGDLLAARNQHYEPGCFTHHQYSSLFPSSAIQISHISRPPAHCSAEGGLKLSAATTRRHAPLCRHANIATTSRPCTPKIQKPSVRGRVEESVLQNLDVIDVRMLLLIGSRHLAEVTHASSGRRGDSPSVLPNLRRSFNACPS